jgi:hypothetical protein
MNNLYLQRDQNTPLRYHRDSPYEYDETASAVQRSSVCSSSVICDGYAASESAIIPSSELTAAAQGDRRPPRS